jgi:hypothetical protein
MAASARAQEDRTGDFNLFARGGVGGFTGDLNDSSGIGPTWGLTANVQPMNVLGVEVAYDGSKNGLTDPATADDASVWRHGASGLVKLGLPFIEYVRPFVGAGLGLSFVSIRGETDGRFRDDFMQEIPLVGGLELNSGGLTAGLRATYRVLIDEGFVRAPQGGGVTGGLFETTASLGGRF